MVPGNMARVLADKPVVGRGTAWTIAEWMDHLGSEAAAGVGDDDEDGEAGWEAAAERRCGEIWAQFCTIAKETVAGIASHGPMRKNYRNVRGRHFNILGLDVVLDADDRAWLCECNDTPDLGSWASWATTEANGLLTDEQVAQLDLGRLDGECRALVNDTVELLGLDRGPARRMGADVSRFSRLF